MKVNEYGSIRNSAATRKKGGTSATGDFAGLLGGLSEESAPAAASGVAQAQPMAGMLGLQEVDDREVARRQTIKHGHSLLESLENLRHSLLTGRLSPEVLRTLEHRLKNQRALTADPALHAVIDDIELRAAVELAKIEHAMRQRPESEPNV